ACAGGKGRVKRAQRRYTAATVTAPAASPWQIPVCVRGPKTRACTLVTEPTAELALPSCPAWLMANADGAGYYVATYTPALRDRLVAAGKELTPPEQLAIVNDPRGGMRAGPLAARAPPPPRH